MGMDTAAFTVNGRPNPFFDPSMRSTDPWKQRISVLFFNFSVEITEVASIAKREQIPFDTSHLPHTATGGRITLSVTVCLVQLETSSVTHQNDQRHGNKARDQNGCTYRRRSPSVYAKEVRGSRWT
jgi:hypothetical protein